LNAQHLTTILNSLKPPISIDTNGMPQVITALHHITLSYNSYLLTSQSMLIT